MTKHYCDRCGKELNDNENISFDVMANGRNTIDAFYLHLCRRCFHDIMQDATKAKREARKQ